MDFLLRGDFRYFWPENIGNFLHFPFAWDSALNTGIGQSQLGSLWIISYFNFTLLFSKLGLNWNSIQLIFWIIPALLLSFFSSSYLFKHLFKDLKYSILAGTIYTLNTYFLLILTGGQLGVSLSFSLVPLVFLTFIKILENPKIKNSILAGLVLGLQVLFDPRIAYVTLAAVLLYLLFNFPRLKITRSKLYLLLPFVCVFSLNSFWILPLILTKNSPLPMGFDSISSFKFFSFAKFEDAISLLHPNWPENIFGKVGFLKPEFLLLPLLAFSSLVFISKSKDQRTKNYVLFFAFLGLVGAFLAKGANEPLGFVNEALFKHLPGMTMFRDPTKWYIFIVLGYSILIPYSLRELSKYFKLIPILFVLYFLYLMSPVFGQIKVSQVPQEYIQLKNFLDNQKTFSRTIWIPQWQRFGFFSNTHPAIGRFELLKQASSGGQIEELKKEGTQKLLQDFAVRFVVVPYDSESEIFLKDRKYAKYEYLNAIQKLSEISWLKKIDGFSRIAVFEIAGAKEHLYIADNKDAKIEYKFINPTSYEIKASNVIRGDRLVFSEGFDKYWELTEKNSGLKLGSEKYMERFNSFILPQTGTYEFRLYYKPQDWVNLGLLISIASFIVIVSALVGLKLKK